MAERQHQCDGGRVGGDGDLVLTRGASEHCGLFVWTSGIWTALGDSAAAIGHAGTVDVRRLGTPERYARYCIDTARAWEQHGRPDRATQALCAAETQAPEELRRPSCHELITRLMYAPTATPSRLRNLAVRAGAIH